VTQPPPPRPRPARPRRSGRRGGDSGTREAILAAARSRFGDYGYDGATIRGIAADAGVDAALVHHFFGTKERLFAAAMRLPVNPGDLLTAALAPGAREPGQGLGEHLVRTVLGAWEVTEMRSTFLGLLRSAVTSEQAAGMMREFATEAILSRIAGAVQAAAGGGAQERAGRSLGRAGRSLGRAGRRPGRWRAPTHSSGRHWWPARCSALPSPGTCSNSARWSGRTSMNWPPRSARPWSAT
jgi:AcrR family transcriptional regulator